MTTCSTDRNPVPPCTADNTCDAQTDSSTCRQPASNRIQSQQITYLGAVPSKIRSLFAKAYAGIASPRQAIQTKCLQCSHADRAEISHCPVQTCPLWAYRPYQSNCAEGE